MEKKEKNHEIAITSKGKRVVIYSSDGEFSSIFSWGFLQNSEFRSVIIFNSNTKNIYEIHKF